MRNDSKFIVKGKKTYTGGGQSSGLASRATPAKGNVSARREQSAFEASRGIPEKGNVTFNDSRYK